MKKICTKCKIEKLFEDFGNDKRGLFGKIAACKICEKDRKRKYLENNREKCRAKNRLWRNNNLDKAKEIERKSRELHKDTKRVYYEKNKKHLNETSRLNYQNNLEKYKEQNKLYRIKNREKIKKQTSTEEYKKYSRERSKIYRNKNKERKKQYILDNKDKFTAYVMERRARKKGQTPDHAIPKMIEIFYFVSRKMSGIMKQQYHVDHIIPLIKGGLHSQENLQVMLGVDNCSKGSTL